MKKPVKLTNDTKQLIQRSHCEVNTIETRKIIARKQRKTSASCSLKPTTVKWPTVFEFPATSRNNTAKSVLKKLLAKSFKN